MVAKSRADSRTFHLLYKTTCLPTKRYYVGMHSTDVIEDGYLGSGKQLGYSIKKHGKEAHVREVIGLFPDRQSLVIEEASVVNDDMLADPLCMNILKGGSAWDAAPSDEERRLSSEKRKGIPSWNKGIPMSEETKQRLSVAKTGKGVGQKRSEETRRKLSEKAREREARKKAEGHVVSEETRARMSASRMGEKNGFYGKKHTHEALEKLSAAAKGRPGSFTGRKHTDETRAKISRVLKEAMIVPEIRAKCASMTGQPVSEETRKKISGAHKGRVRSAEHAKKLSEVLKGNKNSLGHRHTDETKKKMAESRRAWHAARRASFV